MNTRANSPLTGIRWLQRGLNAGRTNLRALLGGAALLMCAWLVPALLQAVLHVVFRPGADAALVLSALMTLLSVALLAPLMGGYLRMLHLGAHGQRATALDIFVPFRTPQLAQRMISFALLMMLVQVILGVLLTLLFADFLAEFGKWSDQVSALQKVQQAKQASVDPASVPALPAQTGRFLGLGSLILIFCSAAFAIGLGQIALGGCNLRRSLIDALAGTVKNVVPLLMLAVSGFGLLFLVGMAGMGVAAFFALLMNLVGQAAVALVVLPLYLLFLATCYVVLFSIGYQIWRDVSGEASAPPEPPSAPDRLAA